MPIAIDDVVDDKKYFEAIGQYTYKDLPPLLKQAVADRVSSEMSQLRGAYQNEERLLHFARYFPTEADGGRHVINRVKNLLAAQVSQNPELLTEWSKEHKTDELRKRSGVLTSRGSR